MKTYVILASATTGLIIALTSSVTRPLQVSRPVPAQLAGWVVADTVWRPDSSMRDTLWRDSTWRDTTWRDTTGRDTTVKPVPMPKPKQPKPPSPKPKPRMP